MTAAAPLPEVYRPTDRAAFHELLRDPSLATQYAGMIPTGELDDPLAHPVLHPDGIRVVRDATRLAAFGMLLVLPSAHGPWAMVRIGVRGTHRRRGIATSLLREAGAALAAIPAARAPRRLTAAAWLPAPDAQGFLERHGFVHFRYFWEMERAPGPPPAPAWPEGIRTTPFTADDHVFAEWTACYNEAFAARFPSHIATVDEARAIAASSRFRPDGLRLAWRGGRCVGFCRNGLLPDGGEVDVLAVRPDAQGEGLGRALLRWGVAWLTGQGAARIHLLVDGENDAALGLYRSEGFAVRRTRRLWSRPLPLGPG